MKGISRRTAIGAGAAFAGTMTASSANVWVTTPPPAFGPDPAPLAGPDLPSFRYALGDEEAKQFDGGWAKEATVVQFPVSETLAGVLMQLDPGRAPRAPLARQRRRVGLCHRRPLPGHHHRPRQPLRDRRLRPRRRLVFSARPRPFDPGHRRQALPVPAGLRQRLLLRVRHLLDQRLGRPRPGRGAGEEFRRRGRGVRQLPQEGGLHLEGPRAAASPRRPAAGVDAVERRSPIATASTPSSPTSSPAAR